MNAASQFPSGVLTVTSVSTTGRSAASPGGAPATAANPAANDTAPNSRRDMAVSSVASFGFASSLIFASLSQAAFVDSRSRARRIFDEADFTALPATHGLSPAGPSSSHKDGRPGQARQRWTNTSGTRPGLAVSRTQGAWAGGKHYDPG